MSATTKRAMKAAKRTGSASLRYSHDMGTKKIRIPVKMLQELNDPDQQREPSPRLVEAMRRAAALMPVR